MKEIVDADAVVVSKATALPKRKASEPFLIPWEDSGKCCLWVID